MSFINVLYPENRELREDCVRLQGKIVYAMKTIFIATNDLIQTMCDNLNIRCSKIAFDDTGTIKYNADILMTKAHELQRLIDAELRKYRGRIDPKLFDILLDDKLELSEKFRCIGLYAKAFQQVLGVWVTIHGIVLSWILGLTVLVSISGILIGVLIIGVAGLAGDFVLSIFAGRRERAILRDTKSRLQKVAEVFVPASHVFLKSLHQMEYGME